MPPSPVNADVGQQRKTVVVLHHEQRELVLLPGKYLIGRSRSCQLIVSSELVSRRHAELCVTPDGRVTMKDLGSHNGVLVNGHRLSASAVALKDCDRFKIGAENFTIHVTSDALDSATMQVVEVINATAPTEVKHAAVPSMVQTRATHDLDLICTVADRAFEMGAVEEAEQLLSIHLTEVLNDVMTTQHTSPAVRDKAFEYGVRLAEVTRQQQWFDFAIDLLLAQGQVASQEQAESLLRAQRHINQLGTERLQLYCRLMRKKPTSSQNVRILTLLEAILTRSRD